jgi:hypothetical protein
MKRAAFLIILLTLAVASMSAYASSGEIQVSYVDQQWAFGGSLYLTDKISVGGTYQIVTTNLANFDVVLGYDVSQTDQASIRATVGVAGATGTGITTKYYPSIGLVGKADLTDMVFAFGSFSYVLDPVGYWTKYSVGAGVEITDGLSIGVIGRGRTGQALKIGVLASLAF